MQRVTQRKMLVAIQLGKQFLHLYLGFQQIHETIQLSLAPVIATKEAKGLGVYTSSLKISNGGLRTTARLLINPMNTVKQAYTNKHNQQRQPLQGKCRFKNKLCQHPAYT